MPRTLLPTTLVFGPCFQGLVWAPPLIVRKASIELGCLFNQWRQISTQGVRLRGEKRTLNLPKC